MPNCDRGRRRALLCVAGVLLGAWLLSGCHRQASEAPAASGDYWTTALEKTYRTPEELQAQHEGEVRQREIGRASCRERVYVTV